MHTDREQPAADMSTTRALPLAGVTVLDLGRIYNGPYAAFLMAARGARRGSRILTS
jgi:crotonobetainyl-CoA:carnitine CoA-transferase CaiB-like acyl-CoA transferase